MAGGPNKPDALWFCFPFCPQGLAHCHKHSTVYKASRWTSGGLLPAAIRPVSKLLPFHLPISTIIHSPNKGRARERRHKLHHSLLPTYTSTTVCPQPCNNGVLRCFTQIPDTIFHTQSWVNTCCCHSKPQIKQRQLLKKGGKQARAPHLEQLSIATVLLSHCCHIWHRDAKT